MDEETWEFRVNNEGKVYWINLKTFQTSKKYNHLEDLKEHLKSAKQKIEANSENILSMYRIPKFLKDYAGEKSVEELFRIAKEEAIQVTKKILEIQSNEKDFTQNTMNYQYKCSKLEEFLGKTLSKEEIMKILFACPYKLYDEISEKNEESLAMEIEKNEDEKIQDKSDSKIENDARLDVIKGKEEIEGTLGKIEIATEGKEEKLSEITSEISPITHSIIDENKANEIKEALLNVDEEINNNNNTKRLSSKKVRERLLKKIERKSKINQLANQEQSKQSSINANNPSEKNETKTLNSKIFNRSNTSKKLPLNKIKNMKEKEALSPQDSKDPNKRTSDIFKIDNLISEENENDPNALNVKINKESDRDIVNPNVDQNYGNNFVENKKKFKLKYS